MTSWYAAWSGLRVAVLGLGVTGFSVADTLAELDCTVLVVAQNAPAERSRILDVLGVALCVSGDHTAVPDALTDFGADLVVVSPGFHPDHPLLVWAAGESIPVWGDIELAWRVRDKITTDGACADWIMVTGTNGKTTTVQLTAAMLAAGGQRVAPCGNIGVPVLDAIRDPQGFDVLAVEASSYQLHWLPVSGPGAPSPHASVCLNVADDHIDWHGSFEAYRDAKAHVYENTKVACVYNLTDATTKAMVEAADVTEGARAIGFGPGVPGPSEFGIVDGILCDRAFLDDRQHTAIELATVDDLRELGLGAPHLVSNVLAAAALARSHGVSAAAIRDALGVFRLDAHRIEPVASANGIRWVDDSKATNPHAAAASLAAFDSVVWIVGGLLKGVDIDDMVRESIPRLRAAVIIGVDRVELKVAFGRHAPALRVCEVDAGETRSVMPNAVRLAGDLARAGDTVLLAPAAASMDQFVSYADRGEQFQAAVQDYLGGEADDLPASQHPEDDAPS